MANSEQSFGEKRAAQSQYLINLNLISNPHKDRIQNKTQEFKRVSGLKTDF